MQMYNPPHPGEVLRECLGENSVTETAKRLGVTRAALSRILNGKAAVSAEMAVRLSVLLPNTDAALWLRLQNAYDLWHVQQKPHDFVIPLAVPLA
ncbi:HigA family addiction module antitoxin [Neisseria bacilliformis]|uniref:HigA family addiction module antitoxin n=1 Tax=Neisseria bacilliformis TaxID=267212 RepID=UPI0028ED3591|nr:HigA family addiction module antitoxin [Neisseria bacilliformis]